MRNILIVRAFSSKGLFHNFDIITLNFVVDWIGVLKKQLVGFD